MQNLLKSTQSKWKGFNRYDFYLNNKEAILVCPEKPTKEKRWIWRAEFFGAFDQADIEMIKEGWYLAYYKLSDMYGCPKAVEEMKRFFDYMTSDIGLYHKTVLFGFSRGGLYAFNYTAAYPGTVDALYLDAPVLDIRSWPGGMGKSEMCEKEWLECKKFYNLTDETSKDFNNNPLDKTKLLVDEDIPIIVVAGGEDEVVPIDENTMILIEKYHKRGGNIKFILKPDCKHHPHSLDDVKSIVDFIITNTSGRMEVLKMFSLTGKVAVVTGGSGRYGKQIVKALAQAGAKVYTASRKLENNEEYAKYLREKGLEVFAAAVDQGDEKSVLDFRDYILRKEKKVDILVNNAVIRTMKNGWEDTAENFQKSMSVNATGLFVITRAFGNHMAETGSGSIINIGSYMGLLGPDDEMYKGTDISGIVPDYFFHKGGMVNFTRFTASLYGPKKVRCNCLCLGGFFDGQDERFVKKYCERTFLKRMANETDIMGTVVFFASDASEYLTGTNIPIDGGYTAK